MPSSVVPKGAFFMYRLPITGSSYGTSATDYRSPINIAEKCRGSKGFAASDRFISRTNCQGPTPTCPEAVFKATLEPIVNFETSSSHTQCAYPQISLSPNFATETRVTDSGHFYSILTLCTSAVRSKSASRVSSWRRSTPEGKLHTIRHTHGLS